MRYHILYEPPHDKTNKMACAPSEDSDQPGHSPSLIRVFVVRSKDSQGPNAFSCGQRWLWSAWGGGGGQADLSLRWAHMPFCWFCRAAAHMWTFPKSSGKSKPRLQLRNTSLRNATEKSTLKYCNISCLQIWRANLSSLGLSCFNSIGSSTWCYEMPHFDWNLHSADSAL